MAKKTRRVRRPGQQAPLQRPTGAQTQTESSPTTSATTLGTRPFRPGIAVNMPAKKVDFKEEYKHVARDLKRVGIISVAVLAMLVILAQFIR